VEDALQCMYKAIEYFYKPTPAILPAMHKVKQCTLSRMFWHCAQWG